MNGNVFVDFAGTSISAAAGEGIRAFNYGIGNVSVDVAGGAMITAKVSGTSSSSDNAPYGIGAFNYGPGNIAVTTSNGDTITSGSSGIDAVNEATAITAAADALVTVAAAGSISSGTILTNSGGQPAGIAAGFLGGTSSTSNSNVNGTVIVTILPLSMLQPAWASTRSTMETETSRSTTPGRSRGRKAAFPLTRRVGVRVTSQSILLPGQASRGHQTSA